MDQIEKKGWEAADWKAKALENDGHLAAANAQVGGGALIFASCMLHGHVTPASMLCCALTSCHAKFACLLPSSLQVMQYL